MRKIIIPARLTRIPKRKPIIRILKMDMHEINYPCFILYTYFTLNDRT